MRRGRRVLATTVATLMATMTPQAAEVGAQQPTSCAVKDQSAIRQRNATADAAGKVYPVVSIHGITGSDGDFDGIVDRSYSGARLEPPRNLHDAIAGVTSGTSRGIDGIRLFSFAYTAESLRWVDDDRVGGAFARTIDCLYAAFGVPVSVVAHSMGGLVTRWVANSVDDQGATRATKLGKVVTLGTPYAGSYLSAMANDALDVASLHDPSVVLLNHLCGRLGTETGVGTCGFVPLYSSLRSTAGRNLRSGSPELAALARWPVGVDVTAIAGAIQLPLFLFGAPMSQPIDLGDLVVGTASATNDPGTGPVITCRYDSVADSAATAMKHFLGIADPTERRAQLGDLLAGSPCYHSLLTRNVEATNQALGAVNGWVQARRAAAIPPVVEIGADTRPLEEFISSMPDLAPSTPDVGCETLDLLSLDVNSRSAQVFHSFAGQSPCPGDPFETYLEVKDGAVTSSASCAELDQTGECDRYSVIRSRWAGRAVTSVDIRACGSATSVCIDRVRRTTRS